MARNINRTQTQRAVAIIPARMESTRFPGKPLKPILGMPMIGHVYHRARMAKCLAQIYVATCNEEIFDYVESIGGSALMTASTHERCTERTAEALAILEARGEQYDDVVMIQGDEPMIIPDMIAEALAPLQVKEPALKPYVTNLMGNIETEEEFKDPNCIKVVTDENSDALYFSRSPIPCYAKFKGAFKGHKQVCVIGFNGGYLQEFVSLKPTDLEIIESIDMLRVLGHGGKVRMVPTQFNSYAVDTTEDLVRVEKLMKKDALVARYL